MARVSTHTVVGMMPFPVTTSSDNCLAALIPGWFPGISSAEYSRCIGGFPPLTADAEAALVASLIDDGENAKTRLIQANLKLVVGIAKQYAAYDVPLMELVRAGNAGLQRATEAFVRCTGYDRFPAFSQRWIRQEIENSINETSLP